MPSPLPARPDLQPISPRLAAEFLGVHRIRAARDHAKRPRRFGPEIVDEFVGAGFQRAEEYTHPVVAELRTGEYAPHLRMKRLPGELRSARAAIFDEQVFLRRFQFEPQSDGDDIPRTERAHRL